MCDRHCFFLLVYLTNRNDLLNIKDNLASLTVTQKSLVNNNVNQRLAALKFPSQGKLFRHLNQFPKGSALTIDDSAQSMDSDYMEDGERNDIVSSQYQREINYENGAGYAAPPLPSLPYGQNHYDDYSNVKIKKYVFV